MQFHGYSIDAVHRTVTKPGGGVIRLEPKACDLLLYFAAHPGEVLSREQLIANVWNGKFVTDDAVMVAVYALRQAFDDDSKKPRFIETIRGRGYRWMAIPSVPQIKPARSLNVLWSLLIALGMAAFLWAVVRPAQPMPSIEKTNALVRAHARGVFFSERRTVADLERAIEEFRGAIAVDERFAEPHAALAEVHVRLIELGAADPASHETAARREVKRALELAPRLALSHAARGSVQFVLDRDVEQAEESFRHAMKLDPSLPGIRRRYSYLLGATGRFSEAMDQARVAANLEPASSNALSDLAWTHVLAGRPADAERLYREALRLDPANVDAHFSLGYCLDLHNAPAEAMQSYRRALQLLGAPEASLAELDRTFAAAGLRGVYASWLERFQSRENAPRFVLAFYAARAGRSSDAIALLRESSARQEVGTLWLAVHPAFASLRGQREFDALVASSFHAR
jgi:DNA-binding winged helix-turn-helix (wHTH) protein/Tfp pilus assembly protein PilF